MRTPEGERARAREHLDAIRRTLAAAKRPDEGRRPSAAEAARIRQRLARATQEPEPPRPGSRTEVAAGDVLEEPRAPLRSAEDVQPAGAGDASSALQPDGAVHLVDDGGAPAAEPAPRRGAHVHACAGCGVALACPFGGADPERCPLVVRAVPARCRRCGPPQVLDEGSTR